MHLQKKPVRNTSVTQSFTVPCERQNCAGKYQVDVISTRPDM